MVIGYPGAVTVRGYSFFNDSYVYIIFKDGTDPYWARSRVLEYLSQVASRLPPEARPALGPDATGVGWVYEYALVDRTGKNDLSQLRSLQDWFLKYELQTVEGVSEVATDWWHGQTISGCIGPGSFTCLWITSKENQNGDQNGQPGSGRLGDRNG